jgi:WD40 repeat protein
MDNPARRRPLRHLALVATSTINLSLSLLLLGLAVPRAAAQERRTDFLGDPLPERALVRIGTTRLQHGAMIQSIAVSDDGRLLASCSNDRMLCVWDARDGKQQWQVKLPHFGAWGLAFTADAKEVVAASRSFPDQDRAGDFLRWDAKTGKPLNNSPLPLPQFASDVVSAALIRRSDGSFLVAETSGENVRVHTPGALKADAFSYACPARVMCVAATRDGKTLVSFAADGVIRTWSVAERKEIAKTEAPRAELGGNMACIAVAPDTKTIVVGLPDGSVRILDAGGKELRKLTYGAPYGEGALAFSPDGKLLYTGDMVIRSWQVETGKEVLHPGEARLPILRLAMASDGKTFACANNLGGVRLVELATGKTLFQGKFDCGSGIALTPDGRHLLTGSRKNIRFWDLDKLKSSTNEARGEPALKLDCDDACFSFALSPDGKRLAVLAPMELRIYDIASKKWTLTLNPPSCWMRHFAWSGDGKMLWIMARPASQRFDNQPDDPQVIRLWDAATGKQMKVNQDLGLTAHSVAFHPGGKLLAAMHLPEAAKVHGHPFDSPQLPPPEDRLETVRLWNIQSAQEKLRFDDPARRKLAEESTSFIIGRSQPLPLVFSPDGRLLAAPSIGSIVVFETASGQPRLRLEGHLQEPTALAFTPDGKVLVSASGDSTVLVWDLTGLQTAPKMPAAPAELWDQLAHTSAERAGRAVWALTTVPDEAVTLLRKSLKPVPPDPKRIPALIADLDDARYAVRSRAMRELVNIGPEAEAPLAAKLNDRPSLETRRRVEELLRSIRVAPPPAEQLRVIRGIEVLERIATPAAIDWLGELAKGAEGAWATTQAREALQRLQKKT